MGRSSSWPAGEQALRVAASPLLCAASQLTASAAASFAGVGRTPRHGDGLVNRVQWTNSTVCEGPICTSVMSESSTLIM
jgi:hypothetical protein